jgi:hypothetical protein
LAYEQRRDTTLDEGARTAMPPAVSSKPEVIIPPQTRLAAMEEQIDDRGRSWRSDAVAGSLRVHSLKKLHAGYVEQFINSPGFGPIRMPTRPSPRYLELREAEPIPLPPPEYEDPSQTEDKRHSPLPMTSVDPANRETTVNVFEKLHQEGLVDFLNPKRFGYVKDLDHVAGFQVHQFSDTPQVEKPPEEKHRWLIQNLELVSLLKHKKPAVYLSDYLPRMDQLRHALTRPLDAFEKSALVALRQGEDLKVQYSRNHLRMLGSLRAVRQCLECHQAPRGDLLGAFSYKLRREPLLPAAGLP